MDIKANALPPISLSVLAFLERERERRYQAIRQELAK